jgi:hypothetical protein
MMQTTRNGYMMTFSDSIQPTGQISALIFRELLTQLVLIWLFGGATEGRTSNGLLTPQLFVLQERPPHQMVIVSALLAPEYQLLMVNVNRAFHMTLCPTTLTTS